MLATNRIYNDRMLTLMTDTFGEWDIALFGGFNDDGAPFWIIKVERTDKLTADTEVVEAPMFLDHNGALTAWELWELRIRN